MNAPHEAFTADEIGELLAAGRDTTVHAIGADRVLRRSRYPRSYGAEAALMEWVRAGGAVSVPQVHRVGPAEMVLERVRGRTMLGDLMRDPNRAGEHIATLVDLHQRIHALVDPPGLRPFGAGGRSVLHLDLHPGNVILGESGPVVIDWTNAMVGDPAADVAMTWLIMATSDLDGDIGTPAHSARLEFSEAFVDAAGRPVARRVLPVVAAHRLADPNLGADERAAIRTFVRRWSL